MDPQATWEELVNAYRESDWDQVHESGTALLVWLDQGGFPPRTMIEDDLGEEWDRSIAHCAAAFAVLIATRESHKTE